MKRKKRVWVKETDGDKTKMSQTKAAAITMVLSRDNKSCMRVRQRHFVFICFKSWTAEVQS